MRTERAQLQHEVDILGQRLTQELLTLKDDVRGVFNDRKMATRMEQRAMETSVCPPNLPYPEANPIVPTSYFSFETSSFPFLGKKPERGNPMF